MLSHAHGDFLQKIKSRNVSSSLITIYYNYYIAYYNERILMECDMEENREAAEAVTTPHFQICNMFWPQRAIIRYQ
jgi:hypothetical protein